METESTMQLFEIGNPLILLRFGAARENAMRINPEAGRCPETHRTTNISPLSRSRVSSGRHADSIDFGGLSVPS
jgi:hypothetical protein